MLSQMLRARLPGLQHASTEPAARADHLLEALLAATQRIELLHCIYLCVCSAAVEFVQVLPEMVFAAECAFGERAVCADGKVVGVVDVCG